MSSPRRQILIVKPWLCIRPVRMEGFQISCMCAEKDKVCVLMMIQQNVRIGRKMNQTRNARVCVCEVGHEVRPFSLAYERRRRNNDDPREKGIA